MKRSVKELIINIIEDGKRRRGNSKGTFTLGLNNSQKSKLRKYDNYMSNTLRLSEGTRLIKIRILSEFMVYTKSDLTKPTYETLEDYLNHISEGIAISTFITRRQYIRSFLTWEFRDDIPSEFKILFKNGRGREVKNHKGRAKISSKTLLLEEDILSLITHSDSGVMKAIISFLYGAFPRVKKTLLTMKRSDIEIRGNDIYYCYSEGKTGEEGREKLKFRWRPGNMYIANYLNSINLKDGDSSLWTHEGNPVNYYFILSRLKQIRELVKMKKPIRSHLIRHAGISRMRKEGQNDLVIKRYAGWSPTSPMIERYSHLDNDDINSIADNKEGEQNGRQAKKPECPNCHYKILDGWVMCPNCSNDLIHSTEELREKEKEEMREELRTEIMKELRKEQNSLFAEVQKFFVECAADKEIPMSEIVEKFQNL